MLLPLIASPFFGVLFSGCSLALHQANVMFWMWPGNQNSLWIHVWLKNFVRIYWKKTKVKKYFFFLVTITPNFSQWCRARSGTCLNPRDVHLWCQSGRCLRIYCQLMLVNSLLLYNLGTLHINAFCFIFWKFWYLSFFSEKFEFFFGNFWT